MRRRTQPLILRLPFAMVDGNWRLERVLAEEETRSWAQCLPLLSRFALSRPEKRFARRLLERKRNLWLFRCHQGGFCGDFIAIDMSSARPVQRTATVMELKSGAPLRHGGRGAGNQLIRFRAAITELIESTNLINEQSPIQLLCGDENYVATWLEGNCCQSSPQSPAHSRREQHA